MTSHFMTGYYFNSRFFKERVVSLELDSDCQSSFVNGPCIYTEARNRFANYSIGQSEGSKATNSIEEGIYVQ